MAAVAKLGGNWVIVRVGCTTSADDTNGSSTASEITFSAAREFWTGDGWAAQYGLARQFLTQQEAETHLAEYRHRMAKAIEQGFDPLLSDRSLGRQVAS